MRSGERLGAEGGFTWVAFKDIFSKIRLLINSFHRKKNKVNVSIILPDNSYNSIYVVRPQWAKKYQVIIDRLTNAMQFVFYGVSIFLEQTFCAVVRTLLRKTTFHFGGLGFELWLCFCFWILSHVYPGKQEWRLKYSGPCYPLWKMFVSKKHLLYHSLRKRVIVESY